MTASPPMNLDDALLVGRGWTVRDEDPALLVVSLVAHLDAAHVELARLRALEQRARAIRDSASGTHPVADPGARTGILSTARLILGEQP